MSTPEQPLTRSEMEDILQRELQHYATKADLAQLETRLIKWMIATVLGGMGVAATVSATLALILFRLLGD